ncbi:phospholipid carrier-dependent glycosyltransferase [Arthrobacter sp. TPD3018]|jgi:dolichyl-phosphate-mannose-protein mannosyltransferase|uniref:phospholipid carrier-dependent glycosyltransferase n=1 Tax=Bacteria TaxID=2 RepID=UPI00257038DF|nr:phospholipid carrier-dependent glycosyltransferase [Arthrobacter sp. TPD3018]
MSIIPHATLANQPRPADKPPVRLFHRPLPAALGLGLIAQLLFSWRLTTPHTLVFDEVHYVPAARMLRDLGGPVNIEHPLLGKTLIAAGMALFGDDPLGWRIGSTLAATAVVVGVFAILYLLFGRVRTAGIGTTLAILNFTVFVQARTAMLDGYMAAFVVTGVASLLWAMQADTRGAAWRRWIAGAVLLGLALGTKWTALPYIGFAGLAFLLTHRTQPRLNPLAALAVLGAVAALTYALTFWPAFLYRTQPLTLSTLLPFQLEMYARQTQVLPPHPYQSAWWTWAFDWRPVWYLYEPVDGAQRGILLLGNPVVMWGGLIAVLACLYAWVRGNVRAGGVALLWIASVAMWALIPKSLGFFYYYYLSSIWLCVVIAAAFDHWRARLRYWDEAFLAAAAVLFVHFYPILAATPLKGAGSFHGWMWLKSWI